MATRSHARGGSLKAEQCDASSSARLSGGLVATIVAGPFCARSRAVHDQRACRLELLSGTGSPGRRPRLSRGTGTRPVPNHAGNGRTLRRSRSPRGVSQSRIRAGFRPPDPRSSHFFTRERSVGQLAACRRSPGELQPPRAAGAAAQPRRSGTSGSWTARRLLSTARLLLGSRWAHLPRTHPFLPAIRATTHVEGKVIGSSRRRTPAARPEQARAGPALGALASWRKRAQGRDAVSSPGPWMPVGPAPCFWRRAGLERRGA
jgi:hypothetical protein